MAEAKMKAHAQFEPQTIQRGNYDAQRLLDFRLVRGQGLRIMSPAEQAVFREVLEEHGEERDFQIAMKRRKEPAGATLTEMGKKHGL